MSAALAVRGPAPGRSLSRHVVASLLVLAAMLAAALWVGTIELSGAVVATGSLVVESNIKKVQHPSGGIVAELRAQEGARVEAGELLIRLDSTTAQANLDTVTASLWELRARSARLEAERDGRDDVIFPSDLLTAGPQVAHVVEGERRLFVFQRDALHGQERQLRERVGQLQEEIKGLVEQSAAKAQETEVIAREYASVDDLWKKNLIQMSRVTSLEREVARIKGERGLLTANMAQAKGKIAETELQILQLEQDRRSNAAKELAEIRAKMTTLREQQITAQDQLNRIEIRAPQAGYVHELAVHAPGAVISPGEPILMIVPSTDALVTEVRVPPRDIEQMHLGQAASLRFPSFDQRTTPQLEGKVVRIAADVSTNQRTGTSYYLVRIGVPKQEFARLPDAKLMPGMPVEAFIRTADRTIWSYLMKPLADQARRAFREK